MAIWADVADAEIYVCSGSIVCAVGYIPPEEHGIVILNVVILSEHADVVDAHVSTAIGG